MSFVSGALGWLSLGWGVASRHRLKESNTSVFTELSARLGDGNEELRNLLVNTGNQLALVDELKVSFSRLATPLQNLMTSLERERAGHAQTKGSLETLLATHQNLRNEFREVEKRSLELQVANQQHGLDLDSMRRRAQRFEKEKTELEQAVDPLRQELAVATKHSSEEGERNRLLQDENRLIAERSEIAEKKTNEISLRENHALERVGVLERDRANLEAALAKMQADHSRVSRQLAETDRALQATTEKLQQSQTNVANLEADRAKLITAIDDATGRHHSETQALELKLDGLRARSEAAEKTLETVRQSLIEKAEEHRIAEAKLFDATTARVESELKFASLFAASLDKDNQVQKLGRELNDAQVRCRSSLEAHITIECALREANEQISSLTGRVEHLQIEAAKYRTKAEEDIIRLEGTIEQERSERTVTEAALDRARKDYASIQSQLVRKHALNRNESGSKMSARTPSEVP